MKLFLKFLENVYKIFRLYKWRYWKKKCLYYNVSRWPNNATFFCCFDIFLTFGYKPRSSRSEATREKERTKPRYSYVKYFPLYSYVKYFPDSNVQYSGQSTALLTSILVIELQPIVMSSILSFHSYVKFWQLADILELCQVFLWKTQALQGRA